MKNVKNLIGMLIILGMGGSCSVIASDRGSDQVMTNAAPTPIVLIANKEK